MKSIVSVITAVLLMLTVFAACGREKQEQEVTTEVELTEMKTYEQITPEEAKRLMESEKDYIILDVRTQEEYDEAHIEGAILIPDYEIGEKAESILKNKEQLILVYCRSGRRSKLASDKLAAMGYTNIKEFGGIIDWPYGTV
jgi:rhodanese-related sulfurtransferase